MTTHKDVDGRDEPGHDNETPPMATPKILVLPGSTRTGSYNVKLAALAVKELALIDADVTRISLEDYPLPIYEDDLEANAGAPANAVKLKQMIMAHHGVFIASPEYSASVTPMLKNAIDWVSHVRERAGSLPTPPSSAARSRSLRLRLGVSAACAR
jgi:NAD(P)H-dependent FMN reductase